MKIKQKLILPLHIPLPPKPPPCRTFKESIFCGLIETKESKQRLRDYKNYMKGYRDGVNNWKNEE